MTAVQDRTAHLPAGRQGRIQEESLYYETLKHEGANLPAGGRYPIIGVNAFLSSKGSPTILPKEVIRATEEEKEAQIATVENLKGAYAEESRKALHDLQQAAIKNENMFAVLMEACKYCSLGQLTEAMFEVGGAVSEEYVGRILFLAHKAHTRVGPSALAGLVAASGRGAAVASFGRLLAARVRKAAPAPGCRCCPLRETPAIPAARTLVI